MAPAVPDRRVALAAIAGAHGTRGELRLKLFAASAESLTRHDRLWIGDASRRLLAVGGTGKTVTVRFEGIDDRSAAEALRGSLVEVERSALPPLGEGEYYHADLIGLSCADREGRPLGQVVAVENFGASDLLEVELPSGKRSLIPFRVGIAERDGDRIVLDPDFLA